MSSSAGFDSAAVKESARVAVIGKTVVKELFKGEDPLGAEIQIGSVSFRVIGVLEQSVNPSIASHGGRADLLALDTDEGIAYLRLSGGCQGCAMSQMTLRQGIETTLLEEVPELTKVIDVTDHGEGENPFYT